MTEQFPDDSSSQHPSHPEAPLTQAQRDTLISLIRSKIITFATLESVDSDPDESIEIVTVSNYQIAPDTQVTCYASEDLTSLDVFRQTVERGVERILWTAFNFSDEEDVVIVNTIIRDSITSEELYTLEDITIAELFNQDAEAGWEALGDAMDEDASDITQAHFTTVETILGKLIPDLLIDAGQLWVQGIYE